jgi:anti-sigma factor RsiW
VSGPRRPVDESDLQAWIDGRLAADRTEDVEAYFSAHPEVREECSQSAEQREALRAAFASQTLGPLPARLRVANLTAGRQRRKRLQLARIAAAIGLLILGGISGWTGRELLQQFRTSASAAFASTVFHEAIAAHRTFSVETRHPVEVAASEEAHLVQWLSKRLGHRIIAPDLASLGFQLMGGRLLPAENGPAALFMYEDGKGTRLSAYYLSVDRVGEAEFKYREQNGVGAFYWIEDGLAYAIVANAPRATLLKIAELVYQQNAPAGSTTQPPTPDKPG